MTHTKKVIIKNQNTTPKSAIKIDLEHDGANLTLIENPTCGVNLYKIAFADIDEPSRYEIAEAIDNIDGWFKRTLVERLMMFQQAWNEYERRTGDCILIPRSSF